MRFKPSGAYSFFYYATQEIKLGKYTFQKDDQLVINIEGLSLNPAEWQRPMEFLPERFDNNNPLSLTPDGKKRHPQSWVPFHGGNRVCFGKTLAESNLKILMTYLTEMFEFKFEDPLYETEFPGAQIDMSHYPSVWLELTARTK